MERPVSEDVAFDPGDKVLLKASASPFNKGVVDKVYWTHKGKCVYVVEVQYDVDLYHAHVFSADRLEMDYGQ